MLKNKLGITFDGVKTNNSADFGQNILGVNLRKTTAMERELLIASVDKVYEAFTTKVAAGRNLELSKVLNIAEGRVWSGSDAVKIGLADANGGLKMAVNIAADKAGIVENFQISEVLPDMDPMMQFIQSLGMQARTMTMNAEQQELCNYYEAVKSELNRTGVQMYCPYRMAF